MIYYQSQLAISASLLHCFEILAFLCFSINLVTRIINFFTLAIPHPSLCPHSPLHLLNTPGSTWILLLLIASLENRNKSIVTRRDHWFPGDWEGSWEEISGNSGGGKG